MMPSEVSQATETSLAPRDGEMAERLRTFNWSATSLGSIEHWPQPLKTLVDVMLGANQPMFVAWGPQRTLLYNDPYREVLANKNPALGCDLLEVWHEIRADLEPLVERAYRGEASHMDDLALVMLRKGYPEETHWSYSYTPVHDEGGKVAGFFCPCHEITAQVVSERRQVFLRTLGDALHDLDDPREVMAEAVRSVARYLGANRVGFGEILPDNRTVLLHTCFADGVTELAGAFPLDNFGPEPVAQQRAGRTTWSDDLADDPAQDPAVWAAIDTRAYVSVPLIRGGRFVASLYVNFRDPHHWTKEEIALVEDVAARTWFAVERARVEAELRASEAQLRDLNDTLEQRIAKRTRERDQAWRNSRDLQIVVDPEGVFRAANDAWCTILGYDPEAVRGRQSLDFVHPDDAASNRRALAIATVRPLPSYENRYRHADGSWRWISWVAAPADGLIYASGRDVTADKQRQTELETAHEVLRQSQKMEAVGQLTGGIAHDFNNLLQGVAGSLDLIRRKPENSERVQRWAEAGLKAATRGAKLTGQLLAFSRAQKLELKPVVLSHLVAAFRDMLDRTIGAQVKVRLALETDGARVLGDEVQIEMAVLNLALNARDAMRDGGELTISTRLCRIERDPDLPAGDYVELAVQDTGAGMPPEVLARAFDPFFTTKGSGKGTGLGLSQVYAAMRQAGGAVRIESRVGMGTTVRLYLRRTESVEPGQTEEPADGIPAGISARVLIVDDDADVRRFLSDALDALGFDVIEAESGHAGLAAVERSDPDLLILDFAMPDFTGAEVARHLQTLRPALPIIFATGFADSAAINGAAGANTQVLRKPFSVEELQRVLETAVRRPR